jgi:aspartate racemase
MMAPSGRIRTLGIIGGIAPASTIDYYRSIIAAYREQRPDGGYPSIVIDSIDLTRLLALVEARRLDELTAYLLEELGRLARAGADVGIIAANTPHIVFEGLSRASPIPLLSIVEAAADAAAELGLERVGLLGTRFTMEGHFYPDVFARRGIEIRRPEPEDVALVHRKYIEELVPGELRHETRRQLLAVIERLQADGAQGILLAGTELPLLLRDLGDDAPLLLDTTRIHVRRAVAELLA